MIVDFFRWYVVYYYGGIYFQYGSSIHVNYNEFIPKNKNNIRLYVQRHLSFIKALLLSFKEIRKGKPEIILGISNQLFATKKKYNPFIGELLKSIYERIVTIEVKEDYDILYICANAWVSEFYKNYKNKNEIELINYEQRINMATYYSRGSWRRSYVYISSIPIKRTKRYISYLCDKYILGKVILN